MRKMLVRCDHCGAVEEGRAVFVKVEDGALIPLQYDLCRPCWREVRDFLGAALDRAAEGRAAQ